MINKTIEVIQEEYKTSKVPWVLGFSGGKDSTALLILLYKALMNLPKKEKEVLVVYCDTGVEIPVISNFVHNTFRKLDIEAKQQGIPIKTRIVYPKVKDRFFSKVIGKGYPTPTNKFRWCTDRLRVKPIQRIFNDTINESVILLGVRKGESKERDKIIDKYSLDKKYYYRQSNYGGVKIFSPIIDYSSDNIWNTITNTKLPTSIDKVNLKLFYEYVGKIPTVDSLSKLNGKGRFGCWTCTVIRKDKAVESLIKNGYPELMPLFEFRNWIIEIRDNKENRCLRRRNGVEGLGPFTLNAREEILKRLLNAQERSGIKLITQEELDYIYLSWEQDKKSKSYIER